MPFRETIIPRPKVDRVNEAIQDQNTIIANTRLKDFEDDKEVLDEGLVELLTPNQECVVRIRALPLPGDVVTCLVKHQEVIRMLDVLVADCAAQHADVKPALQVWCIVYVVLKCVS